jgi:hypothetical protein
METVRDELTLIDPGRNGTLLMTNIQTFVWSLGRAFSKRLGLDWTWKISRSGPIVISWKKVDNKLSSRSFYGPADRDCRITD